MEKISTDEYRKQIFPKDSIFAHLPTDFRCYSELFSKCKHSQQIKVVSRILKRKGKARM